MTTRGCTTLDLVYKAAVRYYLSGTEFIGVFVAVFQSTLALGKGRMETWSCADGFDRWFLEVLPGNIITNRECIPGVD